MRAITIVILTITSFHLAAQHSYLPSVKTLTTEDGLSSNIVYAFHRDVRGIIWIGTEYGLDRYDGQSFDFFSKDNQEHMTISTVHNIVGDGQGYLWILKNRDRYDYEYTSCELNIFDTYSGKAIDVSNYFEEELPFDPKLISCLSQVDEQTIFIQIESERKAFFYTAKEGFKAFSVPENIDIVRDIIKEPNSEGAESFMLSGYDFEQVTYYYRLTEEGKIIETLEPFFFNVQSNNITETYSSGGFWTMRSFMHFKNKALQPPQNSKHPLYQVHYNEQEDLFWLRDENKVMALNRDFEVIYDIPYHLELRGIVPFPLLFDGEKTWFSDNVNGIKIITLQANHFKNVIPLKNGASNSMRGIMEDDAGNVWFSNINSAIGKLATDGQLTTFPNPIWFTSFEKDKSGKIWWGQPGELVQYDPKTNTIQTFPNTTDVSFKFFWNIHAATDGKLWITVEGKILIFNPVTSTFEDPIVLDKKQDPQFCIYDIQTSITDRKKIWVSTNRGLFLLDKKGKILAFYNSEQEKDFYLPAIDFHHMYQEKDGTIWLATGDGGLISWQLSADNEQSVYKQYTISQGLSSNAVHAVYEDDDGYLWMSSDDGLMQFDKANEQVTKYFKMNGLVENEFNRISHYQATDGTLYFGSINGWTTFHPKDYADTRERQKAPQLTFVSFQQFSGKQSTLIDNTKPLLTQPTIKLRPGDRFFSIRMSLLDFYNNRNTTFQYRVKGLYDWQSSKSPILNFSGLPYGTHTLEITAQSGNGQKAANILEFKVRVLRPFYLQWWFILLILGTLGTGLFFFIKWRTQQLLISQETAQLRNLDQLKTKFFANISHELRTPITLILAPLSQLRKKDQLTNADKPSLDNIYKNGQNLLNLVNEILDLSKLEADKLELQTTPTTIPQFFHRIAAQFESAAKVKNIDYQFVSTLSHDLTIQLDRSKMEKVINNLLSNAIKFTPKDGQIQMSLVEVAENQLQIKVKDSGRGIPQDDIPYIFDRYFQSKSNTALEGGTGIGLALTKELVELMDGQVTVQSKVGEGTVFEIKMPIELVEEELVVTESVAPNLVGFQNLRGFASPESSAEKDTILLVEDNPSLQEFIHSILAPHYNVIVQNNGLEALNWLTNHQSPITNHLILSDVMMPEMDGFTLLEKVKANDDFCSIPFILLTARADIQDKLHGLRIGVDDYMTKPFEVEELLLRIKNLIANSKSRALPVADFSQEARPSNSELPVEKATGNGQQETGNRKQETGNPQQVTGTDLEFLQRLEVIAKREITNSSFTIDDMAAELLVSKRQVSRKIKKITGLTPNKYLREVKLHEAKRILDTEDVYTVSEVSIAVGFENPTYFARIFHERFGKKIQDYLTN